MTKRSVYIPDGLWAEIQGQVQGLNLSVSEIIQTALRQAFGVASAYTSPRPHRGFEPTTPPIDPDTLERLRSRFRQEAQAAYEEGHRLGAKIADRMSWPELNGLAGTGWRAPKRDGDPSWASYEAVLGEAWGPQWVDRLHTDHMAARGIVDALQAVWDFVTSEQSAPRPAAGDR